MQPVVIAWSAFTAALVLLPAFGATPAQRAPMPGAGATAVVLSVGDGDTLRVREGGQQRTVRLACIDAPELAQAPHGQQARHLLVTLAPAGTQVQLRPQTTDRYGRTVAEVLRDGTNLNLRLVRRGRAFAYRQYLGRCDAAAYLGAERAASTDRLGVWERSGGIQRPWQFRQQRQARSSPPPAERPTGPTGEHSPRPTGEPSPRPAGMTQRLTCRQIGNHARAQELLRLGHSHLDGDGDGEACEALRPGRG